MRRFNSLRFSLLMTSSLLLAAMSAAPAAAGSSVDPDTLTPPPPPGATCQADGRFVICHTTFDVFLTNEPVFDLPCGTVYETSTDLREGIRWYLDGLLVKRLVFQQMDGSWSLSPTGSGPSVTIAAHANWSNLYAAPGDESTGPQINHGDGFTASAPGFGVIVQLAGLDEADGTHHGTIRFWDDPAVAAHLCEALTA
jgi:hypothetical protein